MQMKHFLQKELEDEILTLPDVTESEPVVIGDAELCYIEDTDSYTHVFSDGVVCYPPVPVTEDMRARIEAAPLQCASLGSLRLGA